MISKNVPKNVPVAPAGLLPFPVAVAPIVGKQDLRWETVGQVGDVGTVVEVLPADGLEVEFHQRDGRTRCLATLAAADVLVLNRERTPVA